MEKNENVVVIAENNEQPVILVEEQPKLARNKVTVILIQDTQKMVKRKGEMVAKAVKHHMAFTDESTMALTSETISNFIIAKLAQYQLMQKVQGRAAFDQTLPIELSIQVNEKNAASGIKFSTNAKALAKILENYPTIVSLVFNPQSFRLGASRADVLKLVTGQTNVLLAKAIDPVEEVAALLAPVVEADNANA